MRKIYHNEAAFLTDLSALIDGWCDRRCLRPLGIVLSAYNAFNGMTDGWGGLLEALQGLALARDILLPAEQETLADLRQAGWDAVERH